MKIITGIITAPGRDCPTVRDTIISLKKGGFANPVVYLDSERTGCWVNWLRALADLIAREADAIMICEDDVDFSTGLREYLEASLWPEDHSKIALCSAFCPQFFRANKAGWHLENRGWGLSGALSWIMPKAAAERISDDFKDIPNEVSRIPLVTAENIKLYGAAIKARLLTDSRVGEWALENNLSVWYHTPSLTQHTASTNSLIGNSLGMLGLRRAIDYDPAGVSGSAP